MGRTKRTEPTLLEKLTDERIEVLTFCASYRYLDLKHLLALTGRQGVYHQAKDLEQAGLIHYPRNSAFNRDTLTDSQVIEISKAGRRFLEDHNIEVHRADALGPQIHKDHDHNLKVCLFTANIECAFGDLFVPLGTIQANAQNNPTPTLTVGTKRITPDNVFIIGYPENYVFFAFELDLTNHGRADYREMFRLYDEIIYGKLYQKHFRITHNMYVPIVTTNETHKKLIQSCLPKRTSPYLFAVVPEYSRYARPPAPLDISKIVWERDGKPVNITKGGEILGYPKAQKLSARA